jgi:glycosyltransferase involved in cell wall biosynthesis
MNWEGLRIGYAPYHKDLDVPADRRRFVFYANERNINFQLADPLINYDIVYLTYGCNLSVWIEYKKNNPNVKFVFELIDSYLLEDATLASVFRGVAWYFLGREEKLWFNYKIALRKMISICDAVVCSTLAQKIDMLRFNKNVHISLDYFSDDITHHKTSFDNKKRLKLVWEGQAYTVENLLLLNNALEKLKEKIELYIVTDPLIKSPIRFFDKKTQLILRNLKCQYNFYNWNKSSFSEIISNADLAIIPIRADSAMMWNKPENKLLLLWEIGIPVLTSNTPSYRRVMDDAGLDFFCASSDDWVRKIEAFIESSSEERSKISEKMNYYLQQFHGKDTLLKKWDMIFDSLNINRDR